MLNESHILEVNLSTLGELDHGNFGRAVRKALKVIMDDITNRPCNSAGKCEDRKLTLELKFSPIAEFDEDAGRYELQKINLEPTCKSIMPPVRGSLTDVQIRKGLPHFNRDVPKNFHANPLPFPEEKESDQPAA